MVWVGGAMLVGARLPVWCGLWCDIFFLDLVVVGMMGLGVCRSGWLLWEGLSSFGVDVIDMVEGRVCIVSSALFMSDSMAVIVGGWCRGVAGKKWRL